jgi:hypothetical protein
MNYTPSGPCMSVDSQCPHTLISALELTLVFIFGGNKKLR